MRFIHMDLKFRTRGELVEVVLSAPGTLKLLDAANFERYRTGRPCETQGGGFAGTEAYRIRIPSTGAWHLVVEGPEPLADTKVTIRIIQPQPAVRRDVPLATVLYPRRPEPGAEAGWCDVFIAHVQEDYAVVVDPLTDALRAEGLWVVTDGFDLVQGEDPRPVVERGLARSRLGILVVTANLFTKNFSRRQLDELAVRPAGRVQVMLPVRHACPEAEIDEHSHLLASAVSRDTFTHPIPRIAAEVAAFLKGKG